jgi:hypothetical protein
VEFGHDDIYMANILTVEKTSQCSDGESENNVKGGINEVNSLKRPKEIKRIAVWLRGCPLLKFTQNLSMFRKTLSNKLVQT